MKEKGMTMKEVRDKYFGGIDYLKIHTCPCCGHVFHDEGDDEAENTLLDERVNKITGFWSEHRKESEE